MPVTLEEITVIDQIVNKIAEQGLSLEQVFMLIDSDNDGILTTTEIK